jgi:hypothetical protein
MSAATTEARAGIGGNATVRPAWLGGRYKDLEAVWEAVIEATPVLAAHITGPTRHAAIGLDQCVRAFHEHNERLQTSVYPDLLLTVFNRYPEGAFAHRAGTKLFADDVVLLWQKYCEAARAKKAEDEKALKPRPWVWRDPTTIPPREWLIGTTLLRRYVTLLGGSGGIGKTAIGIGLCLAYITGRADILGQNVFQTGRAWINVLEDDLDELDRRIHAAMIQHKISRADIEGKLFINTGDKRPIMLAYENPETRCFEVCADAGELEAGIRDMGIGLTMIDPLVKAHRAAENSNEHMDQLITTANGITKRTNSAVLLNAHFRKNTGTEATARDAFRGGSSLIDGARIARSLVPMTPDEAKTYKINPDDAFRYLKLFDAKANMAPKDKVKWVRLASVDLGNTKVNPAYQAGDNVQAAVAWKPPAIIDGLDYDALVQIFEELRAELPGGWQYSPDPRSPNWAGKVLINVGTKTNDEAKEIIARWLKVEFLTTEKYWNPSGNKVDRIVLNEAKIEDMLSMIRPVEGE